MSANDPDGPDDRNGEESDERTMSDVDHGGPGPNAPLGDDVDNDDVVDLDPDEYTIESGAASAAERSDFEFGPHEEATDADVEEAMAGVAASESVTASGESAAASYGEVSDEEAAAALLDATDEEVAASVVGAEVGMAQQNAAATLAAAMDAGYEPNDPVNALPALADETMPVAAGESETMPVAAGESETAVEAAAAPGVSASASGPTAATAGGPAPAAAGSATAATAGGSAPAAAGGATAATAGRRARADAGAGPGWTGYYGDDPESNDRKVIDLEEGEDYWWHDDDESEETGRDAGSTGDRDLGDLHDRLDAVGDRLDGVGQGLDDVATGMEDLTATVEAQANARAGAGGVGAGGVGGLEGMLIQRGQMDLMKRQNEMENRLVRIEQKLDNLDQSPQQRRPTQHHSRNWKTPTGPVEKTPKSYSSSDEVVKEAVAAPTKRATSGLGRIKEGIKSRIPGLGGDDGPEDTGRGTNGDNSTGRGTNGDEAFTPDDAPDVDPAAAETGSAGDPFADADEGEATDDEEVSTGGPDWDGAETGDRIVDDHLEDRVGEDAGGEANEADHAVDEDGKAEAVDNGVPR